MNYSSTGIIALLLTAIINFGIFKNFKNKDEKLCNKKYRNFICSVMVFYISDILWGILYDLKNFLLIYSDTLLYFIAMAFTILLWTRFVISYLGEKKTFCLIIRIIGLMFLIFDLSVLLLNFFLPKMFWFDKNMVYHSGSLRYSLLIAQIGMYLITSIYLFVEALMAKGSIRRRYRSIYLSGFAMIVFITLQTLYPLMPFYALGCLFGSTLMHTFVLEDEKEERLVELEALTKKDEYQEQELKITRKLMHTDALTGVKNKLAYSETIEIINESIENKGLFDFGVVVFDLNGLKNINDTLGHDAGDRFIKEGVSLICSFFKHSPVFRIGGDEFVALLQGYDFINRNEIFEKFDRQIDENLHTNQVVIARGFEQFNPENHTCFQDFFETADKKMYEKKRQLKSLGPMEDSTPPDYVI